MPPDAAQDGAEKRLTAAADMETLAHEKDERVLLTLLEDPDIQQKHLEVLLSRLDLSANVVAAIAAQPKWMATESVRLGVAAHPKTAKRVALGAIRQLFLFDLLRLCMLPSAPPDIRRAAEDALLVRVPHLPLGEKISLARRSTARVAAAILAEGHPQTTTLALANASLTESQVLRVLAAREIPECVVAAISQHPKWATLYNIRVALVRSPHTPGSLAESLLQQIKVSDLRDLTIDSNLVAEKRRLASQELDRRKALRLGV